MDIVQANLIENMVDDGIGKHYKIIDLEKTCSLIGQTLESGEKRMDRMQVDINTIKNSQFEMANNVTSITKAVNGNGAKGIAKIIEDNALNIGKLITKTVVSAKDINRLDKFNWLTIAGMMSGFIGLVFYIAKNI